MRDAWQMKSLGSVCDFENGDRGKNYPGRKAFVPTGIPFINAGHLDDGTIDWNSMDFIPRERFDLLGNGKIRYRDILFCLRGSLGKFGIIDEDTEGAIASSLVILRPMEQLDSNFLAAYLRSRHCVEMISRFANGAAQPNLSAKNLRLFEIPIPPLPEQKRIVAILDEAFEKIAKATANAEKNLANARELFESYLNDVFTKTGEGWERKSIGEIAEHCLGKMLDKKKNKGTLKPYIRNKNVQWFNVDISDVLEMRIADNEIDRYSINRGDLLICEGGYPGRAAIWDREEKMFFQKAVHRVRCKTKSHNRWLLYYLYLSDVNGELRQHFTGSGIQHFTGQALKRLIIPIAPKKVVEEALENIKQLEQSVNYLENIYQQKLDFLNELKQSLLAKAFSGELTDESEHVLKESVG